MVQIHIGIIIGTQVLLVELQNTPVAVQYKQRFGSGTQVLGK